MSTPGDIGAVVFAVDDSALPAYAVRLQEVDLEIASLVVDSAERRSTHEAAVRHLDEMTAAIAAGSVEHTPEDLAAAEAAVRHALLGLEANRGRHAALEDERRSLRIDALVAEVESTLPPRREAMEAAVDQLRTALAAVEAEQRTTAELISSWEHRGRDLQQAGDTRVAIGFGPSRIGGYQLRSGNPVGEVQELAKASVGRLGAML